MGRGRQEDKETRQAVECQGKQGMTWKMFQEKYVKLEIELFRKTLRSQSCGEKRNVDGMGRVLNYQT